MLKKRIRQVIAGMCVGLILPVGMVHTGFAKELESVVPTVSEKSVNQGLKLWYTSPANINTVENSGGEWMQQSLPLGNGNLGNLIFGGIAKERIHFNEKTLWTGGPAPSRLNYQFGNKQTSYTQEDIEEYRNILDDKSTNVFNDDQNLGGLGMGAQIKFSGENNLLKGSYQDFGDIWLDFSDMGMKDDTVEDYRRELDLQTGVAETEFSYKDVSYKREHFVSSPDKVMITELSASEKGKLDLNVKMELNNSGLEGTTKIDSENQSYTIAGKVKDNDLKFRTTMKIVLTGGTLTVDEKNQAYKIQNADRVLLIMSAETDYKNDYPVYRDKEKNLEEVVDKRVNDCAKRSYDDLKKRHIEDHQSLFDRVSLDLGEQRYSIPTNQLVDEYREGKYSKYLEVLAFQYGRYLTIAGSRGTLPSNLVGLWTVGNSAWTGDYHFNVNVQMNYWPVYSTNLAECGYTFVEYMENLREPGRLTAERVHGIKDAVKKQNGFTVHTENNPFGMTAPTNAQEYGWNPTGAAWAIQNLWWHYEFTEDEEYLKNTIYPIMKEAALFWDAYLWTSSYQKIHDESSPFDGQARLVVAPSFSEEQGPTAIGTTYDQSLVWELYNECVKAGRIIGEDEEILKSWEEKMKKLDPIEINETNGIKEWYEETRVGTESGHNKSYAQAGNLQEIEVPNSGWNIGHLGEQRHASHLVGLFPGTLINKENKTYMNAAIQSLTERGEYSTGWSKANKINLWARAENGEKAYSLLNNLIGGKSSGLQYNLFDSHGSGGGETMMNGTPVWQIDGNFGLTSGVVEMLVQSQLGYTQFLPAIPSAWENGNVQGLKARGNFTIGERWENGVAEEFTVCYEGNKSSSTFIGSYDDITSAKVYENGKEVQVTKDEEKNHISFETLQGKTYTIDMSETNSEELKNKADEFLKELHPDLHKAGEELRLAVEKSSKDLGIILTKAKQMNQLYLVYLNEVETIYCLTDKEGLTYDEIDSIYNRFRELQQKLLENTGDLLYYQEASNMLNDTVLALKKQMGNRVISFSKESGILQPAERTLVLSKSEKAADYEIRYTLDGSIPRKASELYQNPLQLKEAQDTVVRAALFYDEQRISPVYTKKYMSEGISIKEVKVSHTADWGETYVKEKMIDGDTTTRWASRAVNSSIPIEITLSFAKKESISQMKFDLFVSQHNGIGGFEIHGLVDGEYKKIYEGTKMGDVNDKVGGVDGASGGYHAYYFAEFPEVFTDSVKIVLKPGYLGEPSLYEITPLNVSVEADGAGNAEELNKVMEMAENADRSVAHYQEAGQNLKDAFEESILDGKEVLERSQDVLDARIEFIRNRYNRLGFGETDKSTLDELIKQAKEALNGEYSNDSLYRLRKVLKEAIRIQIDENVKQPTVDRMVQLLQKVLDSLEIGGFEEVQVASNELNGGDKWIQAGAFKATDNDDAGPLTYQFTGHFIQVSTVEGNDHGVIRVTIMDKEGKEAYYEEIDTYAPDRSEGIELMQRQLKEGEYTIRFERVGKSQHAADKRGWVEVGMLKIHQEKIEEVDRSMLESEVKSCEALQEKDYTKESWEALQKVIQSAKKLLEKADAETCTAEMEDKAAEVAAVRAKLQTFVDISELKEVLQEAKNISSEGYTQESYEELLQSILEAENLLQGTYTQEEINQKTALLKQKMNELCADKSSLQKKYDEVKDLIQGLVTEESWKAFIELKEEAKKVLENPNATPSEVEEILGKLNRFEFLYKEVADEPGKPDVENPKDPNVSDDESAGEYEKPQSKPTDQNDSVATGDNIYVMIPVAGILIALPLLAIVYNKRKIK